MKLKSPRKSYMSTGDRCSCQKGYSHWVKYKYQINPAYKSTDIIDNSFLEFTAIQTGINLKALHCQKAKAKAKLGYSVLGIHLVQSQLKNLYKLAWIIDLLSYNIHVFMWNNSLAINVLIALQDPTRFLDDDQLYLQFLVLEASHSACPSQSILGRKVYFCFC